MWFSTPSQPKTLGQHHSQQGRSHSAPFAPIGQSQRRRAACRSAAGCMELNAASCFLPVAAPLGRGADGVDAGYTGHTLPYKVSYGLMGNMMTMELNAGVVIEYSIACSQSRPACLAVALGVGHGVNSSDWQGCTQTRGRRSCCWAASRRHKCLI